MNNQIEVIYSYVDGAHFFWSEDAQAKGLLVASSNLKAAWDEVTTQMNILIKENCSNPDAICQPAASYDEFVAYLRAIVDKALPKSTSHGIKPFLSAGLDWRANCGQEAA